MTERPLIKYIGAQETQRVAALTELNRRFPGERKKVTQQRDSDYTKLRTEINNGNFNVLTQQEEGGV